MTQKYYRIEFTAHLQKMTLACKMQCQIEAIWKRGQKVAQTGKQPFRNCLANFNSNLTISCNMVFDSQKKLFKQKLTKFVIALYTQKGTKQAGFLDFDVAPFLNERNKSKAYELGLKNCPDKNAKLNFTLKAKIIQEKAFDQISQSSMISVDLQNITSNHIAGSTINKNSGDMSISKHNDAGNSKLVVSSIPLGQKGSNTSIMQKPFKKSQVAPTTDRDRHPVNQVEKISAQSDRAQPISTQELQKLEQQNKKMLQKLKKKSQLLKQNQQLRRRLKDDDYQSCKEYKKKIQQGKKDIQKLQQQNKNIKKINQDIKQLQKNILKSKEQIMSIFNQADKYGPDAMEKIQQACGLAQY